MRLGIKQVVLKGIGIAEMLEGAQGHLKMLIDTQKWKSGHNTELERAKDKWCHNSKENILKFRNRIIKNRT